jgi:hypothetical protein
MYSRAKTDQNKTLLCFPGVPVEAAEPRFEGSQQDAETGSPVVQVHRLHRHLRPVQAVRESRVHGAQVTTTKFIFVF